MATRIFMILLLLSFSKGFCQLNDGSLDKKRKELYVELITSIQQAYPNVPLHINIQSKVQIPSVTTGMVTTIGDNVTTLKDTLLLDFLKRHFATAKIDFTNKDSEIMLKSGEIFTEKNDFTPFKKKILVNIYEPLDSWVHYFATLTKRQRGKKNRFNLVYLPVKLSVWTLNEDPEQSILGDIDESINIYVYNINGDKPLLRKTL